MAAMTAMLPALNGKTSYNKYDEQDDNMQDFDRSSNEDQNYYAVNENPRLSNNNIGGNNLQTSSTQNMSYQDKNSRKSRRVTFYKNGDKYFLGKLVTITPNKYFSFKELMNELNRSVDLPYGVRRVYSPISGREIYDIDDLIDGSSYVCASFEPFRPTKYGDLNDKPWNANIGRFCFFFNFS